MHLKMQREGGENLRNEKKARAWALCGCEASQGRWMVVGEWAGQALGLKTWGSACF